MRNFLNNSEIHVIINIDAKSKALFNAWLLRSSILGDLK